MQEANDETLRHLARMTSAKRLAPRLRPTKDSDSPGNGTQPRQARGNSSPVEHRSPSSNRPPGKRDAADTLEAHADPVLALRDADVWLDVQNAFTQLGDREQKVIRLLYVDGVPYEEAAARLDLPLGTLKRLQTGALRFIRQRLLLTQPNRRSPQASNASS